MRRLAKPKMRTMGVSGQPACFAWLRVTRWEWKQDRSNLGPYLSGRVHGIRGGRRRERLHYGSGCGCGSGSGSGYGSGCAGECALWQLLGFGLWALNTTTNVALEGNRYGRRSDMLTLGLRSQGGRRTDSVRESGDLEFMR